MDRYLCERIRIFLFRDDLLSLRSAINLHASCEWFGPGGQLCSRCWSAYLVAHWRTNVDVCSRSPRESRPGVDGASRCATITKRGSLGGSGLPGSILEAGAAPTPPPSHRQRPRQPSGAPALPGERSRTQGIGKVRWIGRCQVPNVQTEETFLPLFRRVGRKETRGA